MKTSSTTALLLDGSSIRGFKAINESDMILIPDPNTAFIDPFMDVTTLNITCDIEDPITREIYNRDPRQVAKMAERYLQSTGIADTAYFGSRSRILYLQTMSDTIRLRTLASTMSIVTKASGMPAATRSRIWATRFRTSAAISRSRPNDSLQDLRTEMMLNLIESGIEVEMQHHEVGTAGQAEST